MYSSTGIKLKGVTFNNPALPRLIDYKDVIASHPSCLGAWRFDRDELIMEDASGINRILSWKDGGPALVSTGTDKAVRAESAVLDGKVGSFSGETEYTAEDFTWNPNNAFTLVLVLKPDFPLERIGVAFGSYAGPTEGSVSIQAMTTVSGDNAIPFAFTGASQSVYLQGNGNDFYVVICSFDGASTTYLEQLGEPVKSRTGAEDLTNLPRNLKLSESLYPYHGEIDFAAIFNSDVINKGGELKTYIDKYLRARTKQR